jgi:hypothetical protein
MFVYEPRARIRHKVPVDRGRWSYFRARCYAEGLSKARVTSFGGSKDGLASERAYTLRTLPLGVLAGLRDAVLQQDTAGLARAGALVLGFAFTVAGYAVETLTERIGPAREFANDPPPVIGPPPERVGHSIEFVATPVLAGTVDPA